jgi:hypothetical protein
MGYNKGFPCLKPPVLKRCFISLSTDQKAASILKYAQALIYIAVVLLWFKRCSPVLARIDLSYIVPLIPLLIIILLRLSLRYYPKRPKLSFRWNPDLTIIILLLLLAIFVRLPFYTAYLGILNSDDAMPLLQAKHMATGELPAIYYYGQTRVGSLPFHVYALLFRLFGYSVFLGITAYFLPFLGFITLQYLIFRSLFSSRTLAFILALFYCLPIRHLLSLSFYIGSNMTYAFFLGSLAMYLSLLVYRKNRFPRISVIGFTLGLALWTYPCSIVFALCATLFILSRVRFHLRYYFNLILYFLVGFFPAILFEFISPDKTFTFVFSRTEFHWFPWEKMSEIIKKVTVLVSGEQNSLNLVYLALIISGIVGSILASIKRRRFLPENIFAIFFLAYVFVYAYSFFPVDDSKLRYLYGLYFAIPFLLVCGVNMLRKKVKYILMLCLFLFMVIFSNARDVHESYFLTKGAHKHLKNIVRAMIDTGERYWLGTFWDVHLLTALSGEKIVGWRYPLYGNLRYMPFSYMLSYYNQGENNNYVFFKQSGSFSVTFKEILPLVDDNLENVFKQSGHLIEILDKLKINANQQTIGDCRLVYGSQSSLLPVIMKADIPERIPEISFKETSSQRGWLVLRFIQKDRSDPKGFKLNVEIKDFFSGRKSLSLTNGETRMRIPSPDRAPFELVYFLEYQGAKLPTTVRRVSLSPSTESPSGRNRRFVYLTGSTPGEEEGERYLEREATIEINDELEAGSKIRLQLFTSFGLHEFYCYGEYHQEVKIFLNDLPTTEEQLVDGENTLEIVLPNSLPKLDRAILALKFKYHHPYPHRLWKKTAAVLKRIEILN